MFKNFVILLVTGSLVGLVLSQSEICLGDAEYWPHPNCSCFYICNNGNPLVGNCPSGLFFNPDVEICDYPSQVPECQGGTREPIEETTPEVTTPQPSSAEPSTVASSSAAPSSEKPSSTTLAPTSGAPPSSAPTTSTSEQPLTEETIPDSTTKPPPGQCPAQGTLKIAHEELCHAYYWCVQGTRLEPFSLCIEGFLFDSYTAECLPQNQVDCGNLIPPSTTSAPVSSSPTISSSSLPPQSTSTPPPPSTTTPTPSECPATGTHYLPYPGNCALYRICIEGSPSIYKCPGDQLFDTEGRECRPKEEAVCTVVQEESWFQSVIHLFG